MSGAKADAREIAAGSGIVLAASAVDQLARFAITWSIAGLLGVTVFGTWSYALTLVTIAGTVAPLGLHAGVVLFVARYLGTGEVDRAKGAALTVLGGTAAGGAVASVALFAAARLRPEWFPDPALAPLLALAAPAVLLQALLLAQVGTLRAFRDVRGFAFVWQVVLPLGLLVGTLGAVGSGAGLVGLVHALLAALALGNVVAAVRLWRRLRGLAGVRPRFEPGPLLAFSVPQSVAILVAKLTLWLDVILLGQLATLDDVGLYRAAASIAVVGGVLVMAVQSALNPVVADLIHRGERERLDAVVQTVTRWLVLMAAPAFMVAALLPDVLLGVFSPAYVVSSSALVLLLVGQSAALVTGAVGPLVAMAGRSRLEMTNGLVAVATGLALHLLLIPRFGAFGAAIASSTSYVVWSALRTVEARLLLGVRPFPARTLALLAGAVGLVAVAWLAGHGGGVGIRCGLAALAVVAFVAASARWGTTPDDRALARSAVQRVARKLRATA